jgi:hypothetical protein
MDEKEYVRGAIDVMTAWTLDSGYEFTWSRFVGYTTDEPDGALKLLMGFVILAGELLIKLEKVTGTDARSHLQEIALRNP